MPLIEELVASLASGAPAEEALERAGEGEPRRAAAAFARARARPELAAGFARWAPDALRSARPAFAAEQLLALAERHAELAGDVLDVARFPALTRVLGSSGFLARLLLARPALLHDLASGPEAYPALPETSAIAADWEAIREAKYRGLLRVAARDLAGRPFRDSLAELSSLADACLAAALDRAAAETGVEAPALLALGKLGGRELNFSSDVDVIFVYEAPETLEADFERNRAVARLVRALREGLEGRGALGFGYRVDLELRPEGETGPLANSVDAALSYYESFGAEWERQALIRLRPVAGPRGPADELVRGVSPFVWRRSISPASFGAVREMKERIERERREAGRDLDHDLKEGPGGIRDVEFLVQALQLVHGHDRPEARPSSTAAALAGLARVAAVDPGVASALAERYRLLRRMSAALRLLGARPSDTLELAGPMPARVASALGYDSRQAFLQAYREQTTAVREAYERGVKS
jgi:glutamate-ammonia-ligase adenylyltransferase